MLPFFKPFALQIKCFVLRMEFEKYLSRDK